MTFVYFILGAFLRRWYGGGFDEKYKWLGNRGLQTIVMITVFLSIYVTEPKSWQHWVTAIVVSCWLQFQFWSRGHGACFDMGRGEHPDGSRNDRYNERWYHIPCDYLFDKVFKHGDKKYGFLYDFIYMGMRYTCPMLPMMIFDWRYVIIGLSVSPVYAFMRTLEERESWLFEGKPDWRNGGAKWAELVVGGIVFSGCYLLKWGGL